MDTTTRYESEAPPSLKEAQEFVGGLVEMIHLPDGSQLLINEEGKLRGMEINHEATALVMKAFPRTWGSDVIVGPALVLSGKAVWE